ncbi:tetratricopeptide repeat protein, partial [bacterium]|nr:tetratricopeptide repeat protein [bacterium]
HVIDEFDASNIPQLPWYFDAHQDMLLIAEKERSLADDEYLDKLIERFLQTNLVYRRNTKRGVTRAYVEAVVWRLRFGINMNRALETLASAYTSFGKKEEQEWIAGSGSTEEVKRQRLEQSPKDLKRLQGEIYFKQERWTDAYNIFKETLVLYPNYLTSLAARFSKQQINSFWMLGRTSEGLGRFQQAIRYYTDAYFAPNPHPEVKAGLERIYQVQHGTLEKFNDFLKAIEAEYRMREAEEYEIIRQNLIKHLSEMSVNF